jgi:hypothetical protein
MLNAAKLTLALLTLVAITATSRATELHTFDFDGGAIANQLDGLSSGSYTSVGAIDEITLNMEANLGVLDFTSTSGSLGIDDTAFSSSASQSIVLNFSSLRDSPIHIQSITMTSVMELGSPIFRTVDFQLDPDAPSQSVYRYHNAQSILLGSYEVTEPGDVNLIVNNLQYGFHSVQSVTIASENAGTSVPEPTTALLLLAGLCPLGCFRIRKK